MDKSLSYYINLIVYGFMISSANSISLTYVDNYFSGGKYILNGFLFTVFLWATCKYYPSNDKFSFWQSFVRWFPFILLIGIMLHIHHRLYHGHFDWIYTFINLAILIPVTLFIDKLRHIQIIIPDHSSGMGHGSYRCNDSVFLNIRNNEKHES